MLSISVTDDIWYWSGAFGRYKVPAAIIWLAREAHKKDRPVKTWQEYINSRMYRIVQEWGDWKDAQEAQAYQKRLDEEKAAGVQVRRLSLPSQKGRRSVLSQPSCYVLRRNPCRCV